MGFPVDVLNPSGRYTYLVLRWTGTNWRSVGNYTSKRDAQLDAKELRLAYGHKVKVVQRTNQFA